MKSRIAPRAALLGALATLVFPVVVVVLQAVQGRQYHPMREAISELALGTDGWLMTIAFCSLAVGTLALTRLIRTLTDSRAATVLLAISAALTALSAFVHADGENAPTSVHGATHQVAGITTFLVTIVAMFIASRRLLAQPTWRTLGRTTRAMAYLGIPAFLLVPVLGDAHMGLAQRVLIGLLIAWNLGTQVYAARVLATPSPAISYA